MDIWLKLEGKEILHLSYAPECASHRGVEEALGIQGAVSTMQLDYNDLFMFGCLFHHDRLGFLLFFLCVQQAAMDFCSLCATCHNRILQRKLMPK